MVTLGERKVGVVLSYKDRRLLIGSIYLFAGSMEAWTKIVKEDYANSPAASWSGPVSFLPCEFWES